MLTFREKGHLYATVGEEGTTEWTSVTSLIHKFTNFFDAPSIALKCSRDRKSKWFQMAPSEIQAEWKRKNTAALERGTWYHGMIEKLMLSFSTIERKGVLLQVIKPIMDGDTKIAPEQKLSDGVYPEHFVYLKSAGICGQSDKVEVIGGVVDVSDLKTNEEIKFKSYKSWDGISKKMLPPLSHLDDCNWSEYCLQLSMYLYIILKHNPALRPGRITITHVLFEEVGRDRFDNPIYGIDREGNYIVKGTMEYDVPYLKSECITLVNYLKDNR